MSENAMAIKMVAKNNLRMCGEKQAIWYIKGIYLHRKSSYFFSVKYLFSFKHVQHVLSNRVI